MKDDFQPLTDSECGSPPEQLIEKTLNDQRQRYYDLRQIWDAMLWLVWAGCQWRALTRTWQSVYYYFRSGAARRWKNNALFEQLKDELIMARRIQKERKASPSAIAVDSQSVKVTSFVCEDTGIDGNKRLKARKRHLAVDALGYPIALYVIGADISDTEAGKTLADRVAAKLTDWLVRYQVPTRLALVRADAGYKTSFVDHVTQTYQWLVDIARGAPHKNQNP